MDQQNITSEPAAAVGKFIEYWGFKSIHGRIWTLVYLADHPISTPEIVQKLGVSKGLVSVAINELLSYDLIERSHKVSHGGQTYVTVDNIGGVVRKVFREREMVIINDAEESLRKLASYSSDDLERANVSQAKLKELVELTGANRKLLATLVDLDVSTTSDWRGFGRWALRVLSFKKKNSKSD